MKAPGRRNRMFRYVTSVCDPLCAPTTTPVLLATIVPGATADSPALLLVMLLLVGSAAVWFRGEEARMIQGDRMKSG